MADHHEHVGAHGAREHALLHACGACGSLEVEPGFLQRVHDTTWKQADAEMRKLTRRARGTHAMFHVGSRHGLELIFRGSGVAARLVVPSSCR